MSTPFDDMHCVYTWGSGASQAECAFIARRWRDAYGATLDASDFYVVGAGDNDAGESRLQFWGPWPNILSGLWRALPSGRVYVADASQGSVHVWEQDIMNPDQVPRVDSIGISAEGIWGLDEEHIYTWGVRSVGPREQEPAILRFDGAGWHPMPHPGFYVAKMHGTAPDLIYAAGRGGGIARWDGRAWTTFPVPIDDHVTDVFVAGPGEVYATTDHGALLEGNADGWSLVTRTGDPQLPFVCVAKLADQLFVGGGSQGLLRRVGKTAELEHHKKLDASSFEVRGDVLLASCPNYIAGTTDGVKFMGTAINSVMTLKSAVDICPR